MRRNELFGGPAEVRPAESLADLAAVANSAAEKGLESLRVAGEALSKAKARVGHGGWEEWVRKNLRYSPGYAARLMRLFRKPLPGPNLNLSSDLETLASDGPDVSEPARPQTYNETAGRQSSLPEDGWGPREQKFKPMGEAEREAFEREHGIIPSDAEVAELAKGFSHELSARGKTDLVRAGLRALMALENAVEQIGRLLGHEPPADRDSLAAAEKWLSGLYQQYEPLSRYEEPDQ